MIIDHYLQQLMVMERKGSYMVTLVKVAKKKGHTYLSAMQITKGLKIGESTFKATIESSGEDNGTIDFLPSIIEKVLEEIKD